MPLFESSVNLWGSQTLQKLVGNVLKFESSVNLWGSQTVITVNERIACLRVV